MNPMREYREADDLARWGSFLFTGGIAVFYARHGVPWYWIADPDSRVVEVYGLIAGAYALRTRAAGDEPLSAEPFPDLVIPPAALWA
jgi:Uma2 family endonuclease